MTPSPTATSSPPRAPRQAALSDDMDYEDKHAFPPSNRSRLGSPLFSRHSVTSVSSVETSPAPPSNAKSYTSSPLKTRHSESELLRSPRNRSQLDEYPRYESKKKMSADFSDDTMSVGSIGGESPKSDKGSWRIHSAVAGPFLTGPLARDFRSEDLKTPRGKVREDMNFDHTGLLFPLAPVLDVIPDTPRGNRQHTPQGFTDVSRFGNNPQSLDGFNLDGAAGYPSEHARPTTAFHAGRRRTTNPQSQEAIVHNGQFYGDYSNGSAYEAARHSADGHQDNEAAQQSSAIVASQASASRNAAASEQSLVASAASDSLETLSKGMADSMAQILAKTQNGRTYGEVQLTTLVQKIHMHMNIMGRTSAAIREDYNKIKAKLEQTITDKKVLEATNYHLQQLVQQYEVERQYFHQYVLHSLQSQSSLIYESMGNLSQNVAQSKYTLEELSARLSRELTNMQGSRGSGNESQLKDILEEIKRAVDVSAVKGAQQFASRSSSTAQRSPSNTTASGEHVSGEKKASSRKVGPILLALLLWVATLGGVYYGAKSSALSELQQQPSPSALLPRDLDLIVDQISQKLESVVQTSEVRKLVYTELAQNPHLVESTGSSGESATTEDSSASATLDQDGDNAAEVDTPSESASSMSSESDRVVEVVEKLEVPPWAVGSVPSDVVPGRTSVEEEPTTTPEHIVGPDAAEWGSGVAKQIPSDSFVPVQDPVVKVGEATVVEVEVSAVPNDDHSGSLASKLLIPSESASGTNSSDAVPNDPEIIIEPVVTSESSPELRLDEVSTVDAEVVNALTVDVATQSVSEKPIDFSAPDGDSVSTILPASVEPAVVVPDKDGSTDAIPSFARVEGELTDTPSAVVDVEVPDAVLPNPLVISEVIATGAQVEAEGSVDVGKGAAEETTEEKPALDIEDEDAAVQARMDAAVARFESERSASAVVGEDFEATTVTENAVSNGEGGALASEVETDSGSESVQKFVSVDTDEASPFAVLSMALRSLADRFVGVVEHNDAAFPESNGAEVREEGRDAAEPADDAVQPADNADNVDLTEDAEYLEKIDSVVPESQIEVADIDVKEDTPLSDIEQSEAVVEDVIGAEEPEEVVTVDSVVPESLSAEFAPITELSSDADESEDVVENVNDVSEAVANGGDTVATESQSREAEVDAAGIEPLSDDVVEVSATERMEDAFEEILTKDEETEVLTEIVSVVPELQSVEVKVEAVTNELSSNPEQSGETVEEVSDADRSDALETIYEDDQVASPVSDSEASNDASDMIEVGVASNGEFISSHLPVDDTLLVSATSAGATDDADDLLRSAGEATAIIDNGSSLASDADGSVDAASPSQSLLDVSDPSTISIVTEPTTAPSDEDNDGSASLETSTAGVAEIFDIVAESIPDPVPTEVTATSPLEDEDSEPSSVEEIKHAEEERVSDSVIESNGALLKVAADVASTASPFSSQEEAASAKDPNSEPNVEIIDANQVESDHSGSIDVASESDGALSLERIRELSQIPVISESTESKVTETESDEEGTEEDVAPLESVDEEPKSPEVVEPTESESGETVSFEIDSKDAELPSEPLEEQVASPVDSESAGHSDAGLIGRLFA